MTPVRREWVDPYRDAIAAGVASYAQKHLTPPEDQHLVAAIGLRETWLGNMPGYTPRGSPDGVGDHGHGRGFFQIDDRGPFRHLIRPAPWPVQDQVEAACEVLADARHVLRRFLNAPRFLLAVVCSYNAGTPAVARLMAKGWDPNRATYQGDYGDDVMHAYAVLVAGGEWMDNHGGT